MTDDDGQQVLAADQQSTTPLTTHRVKFYQLNVDTNWEDKGTGSCTYHQVKIENDTEAIQYTKRVF